jgi:hypothetical protein
MYLETVDSATLKPNLQQFTVDARRAPQWVFLVHSPDEIRSSRSILGLPDRLRDFQRQ